MYTEKEKKQLRRELKTVTACGGDCRNCNKLEMLTATISDHLTVYCWSCKASESIQPYSNTVAGLQPAMIEALQFELS